MQAESIVVIVAVSSLLIYVLGSVIRAWKRGIVPSWIPFILMFIGVIFLILVIYRGQEIQPYHWAEVLVLIGLLLITAVYADSTAKMAEEMRRQRYTESLPLLVPDITRRSVVDQKLESNEVDYATLQTGVGLEVTWHNLGKGVAINTRLSFSSPPLDNHPGKSLYFPPHESKALGVAAKESISFEWKQFVGQLVDQTKPRLEAEYQDIYERNITTVQEFHIEEQNGNRRAFLGELYFTINGRRLGGGNSA